VLRFRSLGSTLCLVTPNGAAIRSIREARGFSLRRLALLIGIAPSTLSRIETAKRGASEENIRHIAKALDTPIEAITREFP
jgi:transcriptional regulator with XRE-family HTH domain